MAVDIRLAINTVSPTSVTFDDTTGVYNAGTNPGGYGAPNISLGTGNSDHAGGLFIYKKKQSSSIQEELFIPAMGDGTLEQWTQDITNTDDGWFQCYVMRAPNHVVATVYSVNDVVYDDSVTSTFYICIQATTGVEAISNTAYWTPMDLTDGTFGAVAARTVLDDSATYSVEVGSENFAITEKLKKAWAEKLADECEACDCKEVTNKDIETFEVLLRCITIKDNADDYLSVEKMSAVLTDLV